MKYLLPLFAALLVGCATQKPVQPVVVAEVPRPVVTGVIVSHRVIEAELSPLMAEEYDPQIVIMDPVYGCLSEEATRKIIAEGLATFSVDYIENARDCEDLAIEATVVFRQLFRRDTANVRLGPPFGVIGGALVADIPELGFIYPGYPCYHAVGAVRCRGGKWLLIEVQSGQIIEMMGPIYEGSFLPFLFVL